MTTNITTPTPTAPARACIDHAAELRGAIAQTRIVFESEPAAGEALDYLQAVLDTGHSATAAWLRGCGAAPTEPVVGLTDRAAAAMRAESAQLVADAERSVDAAAAQDPLVWTHPLAVLAREVSHKSNKLRQPADLVVQLLVLAELRGIRAEQAGHHMVTGMVLS